MHNLGVCAFHQFSPRGKRCDWNLKTGAAPVVVAIYSGNNPCSGFNPSTGWFMNMRNHCTLKLNPSGQSFKVQLYRLHSKLDVKRISWFSRGNSPDRSWKAELLKSSATFWNNSSGEQIKVQSSDQSRKAEILLLLCFVCIPCPSSRGHCCARSTCFWVCTLFLLWLSVRVMNMAE